jgi:hypothetical protein
MYKRSMTNYIILLPGSKEGRVGESTERQTGLSTGAAEGERKKRVVVADPSKLKLCMRHSYQLVSSIFHRGVLLETKIDMMLAYTVESNYLELMK